MREYIKGCNYDVIEDSVNMMKITVNLGELFKIALLAIICYKLYEIAYLLGR